MSIVEIYFLGKIVFGVIVIATILGSFSSIAVFKYEERKK